MGEHSYELAINEYADLNETEYQKLLLGYKPYYNDSPHQKGSTFLPASNVLLPDKVDWRDKGYVTPVKNQGMFIINCAIIFHYFSSEDAFTG